MNLQQLADEITEKLRNGLSDRGHAHAFVRDDNAVYYEARAILELIKDKYNATGNYVAWISEDNVPFVHLYVAIKPNVKIVLGN